MEKAQAAAHRRSSSGENSDCKSPLGLVDAAEASAEMESSGEAAPMPRASDAYWDRDKTWARQVRLLLT